MTKLSRRQALSIILLPMIVASGCAPASPSQAAPVKFGTLVSAELRAALRPFDPRYWPGTVPPAIQTRMQATQQMILEAMRARDLTQIQRAVTELQAGLGVYLGAPEVLQPYGAPIETMAPDIEVIRAVTRADYAAFAARGPWRDPRQSTEEPTARLRVTARAAEAMIRLHLAGLDPDGSLFEEAVLALDYAVSVQASNGVFGYPFIPAGGSAVAQDAADLVTRQRAMNREMVEKGWIVDDLNNGGLEFDNAAVATTLLLADQVRPKPAFMAAAIRAGEWALARPFVANINYNTLSAFLLARLYRVTREPRWLEGAKDIFRYVVLPTQLSNGRWMDPHNARIQYHSIILRHGLELHQALTMAGDPFVVDLTSCLDRGLNNLAAQIVLFGSSNTDELLATESLVVGRALLGDKPLWTTAINIDVNYLMNYIKPQLRARGMPVSAPLALLVLAAGPPMGAGAFELANPKQLSD